MSFYPVSFHIDIESKAMYSYQFVEFINNEHLFTGLVSAIRTMHDELFKEELSEIRLNNYSVLIQNISDFDVILLYHGDRDQAEQLLMHIIEIMIDDDLIEYFNRSGDTSVVEFNISRRFTDRLREEIPLNFSTAIA